MTYEQFVTLYYQGLNFAYRDAFIQYFINKQRAQNYVFIAPYYNNIKLMIVDKNNMQHEEIVEALKHVIVMFTTNLSNFGKLSNVLHDIYNCMTIQDKLAFVHECSQYKIKLSDNDMIAIIYEHYHDAFDKYMNAFTKNLATKYLLDTKYNTEYFRRLNDANNYLNLKKYYKF